MKKKIVIAAIALASVFAGTVAFESFTGQNEAKATCRSGAFYGVTDDGNCFGGVCYYGSEYIPCNVYASHTGARFPGEGL